MIQMLKRKQVKRLLKKQRKTLQPILMILRKSQKKSQQKTNPLKRLLKK